MTLGLIYLEDDANSAMQSETQTAVLKSPVQFKSLRVKERLGGLIFTGEGKTISVGKGNSLPTVPAL